MCVRWCGVSPDPSQKTDWNLCTTINFLGATDKSRSWYLPMLVSLRYERRRPSVRQRSNNCLRYAIFRAGWVKGGHLLENYFSFFTRASVDKYTHFLFIVSSGGGGGGWCISANKLFGGSLFSINAALESPSSSSAQIQGHIMHLG